jgi:anti-sigma regulatory factor (Ser/Thr protein kinase)
MIQTLTTVLIEREQDIVVARQRARQIAAMLELDPQDQARVATAVSELARNAFQYADAGKVTYSVTTGHEPELVVKISDEGPGIEHLDDILDGRYESSTGMGLGIVGARRLMDRFEITSQAGAGATVSIAKRLGRRSPTSAELSRIADSLAQVEIDEPTRELQLQNQELMRTLDELNVRRQELARLNRELQETNRGVVALYAELDERAEELRRNSEAKSGFLSSVSHELRTPLSSILALCDLLLGRTDPSPRSRSARSPTSAAAPNRCCRSSTTCSTWRESRPARRSCTPARSRSRTCSPRLGGCSGRCTTTTG